MDEILVIGAGPAGLLAAWIARQRGARVRVMATGIGTTHVAPGWIRILTGWATAMPSPTAVPSPTPGEQWIAAHPDHPYAVAGLAALAGGIAALREVGESAGIRFGPLSGDGSALPAVDGLLLPTALGAAQRVALAPASFIAGDLRRPDPMLIAGPRGWRDFYPSLCADNLARQGFAARAGAFDLPQMERASRFDLTSAGLARLFEDAAVRRSVADQIRPQLDGARRVGLPAVLGLTHHAEVWTELQDRLGVPVFEIPTLPPSVPGMRLYNAFKAALKQADVPILLDMTVTRGETANGRATGLVVPNVVREVTYRCREVILATGGLYGGGIATDHRGEMREVVFGLPLRTAGKLEEWFRPTFLTAAGHPVHAAGVRANAQMQPVDEAGRVVLENVRVAGHLLAGANPPVEGSTEGIWLATAYRAAVCATGG
ncbi:MAG: anaerobic glycerol-3-phosphate dehydrogenase subunit GlpB [Anaerolineae bacterium]|nr:anaerobic glycerol-3-phosphate dehydrogenase subunit GlpB [Anaerolineae bacterium]